MEDYDRLEINRFARYTEARRQLAWQYRNTDHLSYRAIAKRIGCTYAGAYQMVHNYEYRTLQP